MEQSFWSVIWDTGLGWVVLILQISGFILAGRVILGDRSTHGTIAWAVSLVLMPVIAVPAYILFGRNRLGSYIRSRRRIDEQFKQSHDVDPQHPAGSVKKEESRLKQWRMLEDIAKTPLSKGNDIHFLFKGRETFDSMLDGLERAQDYILFQFFIYRDDSEGRKFTNLLKKKAREGVNVYFLVDAIGSRQLPDAFFRDLEEAGICTGVFLPGRTWRGRLRLNFRNHRKVVLIDGKEAWIGGNNIGLEYVGEDRKFGPWRDTHVHIKGPVVNAIQFTFIEDWYWVTRSLPALHWDAAPTEDADVKALCLSTGPADGQDNCTLAFVHMINQAKDRLWIQTPYFVPSEEIIVALQLATLRGVDVRILLPGLYDRWLVWISSFYYVSMDKLQRVRFYRYKEGFFHSKMLLVDNDIVSVGTVNFDNRSFRINFEMTLVLQDENLVRECEEQMKRDLDAADEDPDDLLSTKRLPFRLASHTIRLLAPLL